MVSYGLSVFDKSLVCLVKGSDGSSSHVHL